jgi:GNAT superfamily N-acetyltransferase
MSELAGHDCKPSALPKEWSIHCIFIKEGFRGQGISQQLIESAIVFARSNGASLISAFPIPENNRSRFPVNQAEFSGRQTTYKKLGFKPSGQATDFYQRMELDCG